MKKEIVKKISAAVLSLTLFGGVLPSVPGGFSAFAASDAGITRYGCFYVSSANYMFFSGPLDPQEVINFKDKDKIEGVIFNGDCILPTYCEGLFDGYTNLKKADISKADSRAVYSMDMMFANCTNLETVIMCDMKTDSLKAMGYLFWNCENLKSVDITGFDTSNITFMAGMFENCSSLESVDLSSFDTSKVTSMSNMFGGCTSLAELDVSMFDTSNVTSMRSMFEHCSSLTELDLSNFDTSKVTDMSLMFNYCSGLPSLDVTSFDTSKVTDMYGLFSGCSSLTELDLTSFNTSKVERMLFMFSKCSALTSIKFNKKTFSTDNVVTMSNMFAFCESLKELDLTCFHTGKLENTEQMFYSCSSLESLVLSNFDTSNVTSYAMMFLYSYKLKTLVLGKNFKKVTSTMELDNGKYGWADWNYPDIIVSGDGVSAVIENKDGTNYIKQSDTEITQTNFSLKGLPFPSPGTKPDLSGLTPAPLSEYEPSRDYNINYDNTYWINASTGNKVDEDDVFKFGGAYLLHVNLTPTQYKFFGDIVTEGINATTKIYGEDGETEFCIAFPGSADVNSDGSISFLCNISNYRQAKDGIVYHIPMGCDVLAYKLYGLTLNSTVPTAINVVKSSYFAGSVKNTVGAPDYELSIDKKTWYSFEDINGVGFTGLEPNKQYTVYVRIAGETAPFYSKNITTTYVTGDVNNDGSCSIADAVLLQSWLLARPDTELANWKAADLDTNEVLNVYDMILLKELVAGQTA